MPLEHEWAAEALFRLADWTNCTGEAYYFAAWSAGSQTFSRFAGCTSVDSTRRCQAEVQVMAGWANRGCRGERLSPDLAGTPCAEVLTGITCFHATGVT